MNTTFSGLTLKQALRLVPAQELVRWPLDAPLRPPSPNLVANLQNLESFELFASEAAKVLLIDILLAEVVPGYPRLKVWKAAPLEGETVSGIADYHIAPKRAYMETPLLCAIEAKRDDFEAGQVQCIAEMAVCRDVNRREGHDVDLYGIVSNGQVWVFYRLTTDAQVHVSDLFTTSDLPRLLGALEQVCAACAENVPA